MYQGPKQGRSVVGENRKVTEGLAGRGWGACTDRHRGSSPSRSPWEVSGGAAVCSELLLWQRGSGDPWVLAVGSDGMEVSWPEQRRAGVESRGVAEESGLQTSPMRAEAQ